MLGTIRNHQLAYMLGNAFKYVHKYIDVQDFVVNRVVKVSSIPASTHSMLQVDLMSLSLKTWPSCRRATVMRYVCKESKHKKSMMTFMMT